MKFQSSSRWGGTAAAAGLCGLALLAGCAGLPPRPETPRATAEPVSTATRLGRVVAASTPAPPDSGFRVIQSGTHALDARIALVRAAERTLDVQYFHIAPDNTGRGFLNELRAAAARDVRVRLLIDDLHTSGQQDALAGLAAHERIEVRVFNPFPMRDGSLVQRFAASLADFGQLQMRMHNKLLVADGAFAITGGRNIADEYYGQSETSAFLDIDALVAGAAVAELAAGFDAYWNSDRVRPVQSLQPPERDAAAARARFADWVAGAPLPEAPRTPVDVLGYARLGDEIAAGRVRLHHGTVRAVADPPEKVPERREESDDDDQASASLSPDDAIWAGPSEIRRVFNGVVRAAEREVVLVSPYAVAGAPGIQRLRANLTRGVRVRLLTNSLASTDHLLAHAGYRRYRRAAIEAGLELYEIDPQPSARMVVAGMRGKPVLRVHAKVAIVDRRVVYIGSMNIDPRSATLNTEIGIVVESEALARDMLRLLETVMTHGAWRVRLETDGGLSWTVDDGSALPLREEPRTSVWQRLVVEPLSWLVPESLL